MVLTARRMALAQALIVPDEQTWTMSGTDPAARGLRPVFAPGDADRLLVPEALPAPLTEPLRTCLAVLPEDIEVEAQALPGLEGQPVAALLDGDKTRSEDECASGSLEAESHAGGPQHEHAAPPHRPGGDESHEGHAAERDGRDVQARQRPPEDDDERSGDDMSGRQGTHDAGNDMHSEHEMHGDHGDMMAIVGEPSADGLVMEPLKLRFGPLGTPLPGGLAVDVTLDGDVVAASTVQALLSAHTAAEVTPSPPDLLAPVAWSLAIQAATGGQAGASPWRGLAALEAERAVSHLAWLRALGRLLSWGVLVDRCTLALEGLPPLARELAGQPAGSGEDYSTALSVLQRGSARAQGVTALVRRNRLFRLRTAGLGVVTSEHAQRVGLRGPVARASGLQHDARAGEPLYDRLGFEPVRHTGGDAYARTLVRTEEARDSLRLACAALRAAADGTSTAAQFPTPGRALEGPRGPLRAGHRADGWQLAAPGTQEALQAGGEAMVDAEWSAALVALASFDLSPWQVSA